MAVSAQHSFMVPFSSKDGIELISRDGFRAIAQNELEKCIKAVEALPIVHLKSTLTVQVDTIGNLGGYEASLSDKTVRLAFPVMYRISGSRPKDTQYEIDRQIGHEIGHRMQVDNPSGLYDPAMKEVIAEFVGLYIANKISVEATGAPINRIKIAEGLVKYRSDVGGEGVLQIAEKLSRVIKDPGNDLETILSEMIMSPGFVLNTRTRVSTNQKNLDAFIEELRT